MYRFQHSQHLYFLFGLLLFGLLYGILLYWRKRKLQSMGDHLLVQRQVMGWIPGRLTLRFIFVVISFAALVIGWANLQKGSGVEKTERKGSDVMIALDVSKSMLATDIQPNRLVRAKQLISTLLDKLHNDRIGLVVFAGKAYLQVPLTIDYGAMNMLLQHVNTDLVPTQGTVISDAIDMATQSFSQKEKKYKTLVIISDGEDHDESAIAKVKDAREAGVVIHTIGVGSPEGTTIFDPETKAIKLDDEGKPIISKLNENELKSIAAAGDGTYQLLRNSDAVANNIITSIDGMGQKNLGTISYNNYTSYFQYFLGIALILLIVEWLIPAARKKPSNQIITPTTKTILLLLVTGLASTTVKAQQKQVIEGNKLYGEKKYKEATKEYQNAIKKNPNYTPGIFNLGNALYQDKNYDASRKIFDGLAKKSNDAGLKAASNYNIGNTYMSEQKWQEAAEAYKQSLRRNPQDEEAKYNLSYALSKMKQQENKNKDNKDQKQKQDQQQKQNKEQDNKKQQDNTNQQNNKPDQQKEQNNEQKQQPQPSKLNEKQAEQLLNALAQEEKKLHDKKEKGKAMKVKVDKDW